MSNAINNWQEGDRVTTPLHGAGTVIGPEMWTDPSVPNAEPKWLERWAVELDDNSHGFTGGVAYYWDRQLTQEEGDAPYCAGCGASSSARCYCGPIARNH